MKANAENNEGLEPASQFELRDFFYLNERILTQLVSIDKTNRAILNALEHISDILSVSVTAVP